MSLQKQASFFSRKLDEIESCLDKSAVENVRFSLKQAVHEALWKKWMVEHRKDILLFLSQSEEKRINHPTWKNEQYKHHIAIAALIMARQARLLCLAADIAQGFALRSRKPVFAELGDLAFELADDLDLAWPFSGEDPWGIERDLDDTFATPGGKD